MGAGRRRFLANSSAAMAKGTTHAPGDRGSMCQVIRRSAYILVLILAGVGSACSSAAEAPSGDDDFRSAAEALKTGVAVEREAAVVIAVGNRHTCAVVSTGRVACWGENDEGQRGDGTTDSPENATFVGALLDATDISAGWDHTCVVRANGMLACWGNNSNGQLGNGTTESSTIPVPVEGITNAVAVSASTKRSCALLADTTVRCWGRNDYGEAGDGTVRQNVTTPSAVNDIVGASAIAIGPGHSCVAVDDDAPWCWGRNVDFRLGNENEDAVGAAPVQPLAGNTIFDIAADASTSCALRSDGDVLCWGANDSGQFGRLDATINTSASPVLVQSVRGAIQVALGDGFGCALDEVGAVHCWGTNRDGQLGRGESSTRPQRVEPVLGLDDVSDLDVGSDRACAIYGGGLVKCWGAALASAPVGRPEFSAYQPSEAAASAANDFTSPAAPINALGPDAVSVAVEAARTAEVADDDGIDTDVDEVAGDGIDGDQQDEDAQNDESPEAERDDLFEQYSAVIDSVGRHNKDLFCSYGVGSDETLRLRDAPSLDSEIVTEMPGSRCQFEFDADLEKDFEAQLPTPTPTMAPTPTPTPLPEGMALPKVIGATPTPSDTEPTADPDPLAGWTAVRFDGPESGDLVAGWVSTEFLTSRSARSVLDPGSVLGVSLLTPTDEALDAIKDVLGTPDEDKDWFESCQGGESRTLRWANLTVEFRRDDPAYEGLLVGADLTVEGPFIAGATIVPGTSTWGDLINETPRARAVNPDEDGTQRWTSHDLANRGFARAYSGTFVPAGDDEPSAITAQRRIGNVSIGALSSHCS